MNLTSKQLVSYFQKAVAEKWGYVWSLNGTLYTQQLAQKYHDTKRSTSKTRDPATYWLVDCARWIGKMAADCSGGIVGAFRTVNPSYGDRSANTFYSQCTETGAISTIPEIPGLCVWRKRHIGIYEGNGYVLEFRGTEYGAVRTKLSNRDFTHWGKLTGVDYGETPALEPTVIKITSPLMRGEDIRALQTALNMLGYDCGEADGVAGAKTMIGLARFCGAHGVAMPDKLIVTIQAGEKTYRSEAI